MKTLILAAIVSMFLLSCNAALPAGEVTGRPYVVTRFESYGEGLCVYYLETGYDYVYYRDDIVVVDSVAKFLIGDTLILNLNKR